MTPLAALVNRTRASVSDSITLAPPAASANNVTWAVTVTEASLTPGGALAQIAPDITLSNVTLFDGAALKSAQPFIARAQNAAAAGQTWLAVRSDTTQSVGEISAPVSTSQAEFPTWAIALVAAVAAVALAVGVHSLLPITSSHCSL